MYKGSVKNRISDCPVPYSIGENLRQAEEHHRCQRGIYILRSTGLKFLHLLREYSKVVLSLRACTAALVPPLAEQSPTS